MFLGWYNSVALLLAFQTVRFLWQCLKISAQESRSYFIVVPLFFNDRLIKDLLERLGLVYMLLDPTIKAQI